MIRPSYPITDCQVTAYRIPTDQPESDGTLEWTATTLVLVRVMQGDTMGIGYTYCSASAATLIHQTLRSLLIDGDAMNIPQLYQHMIHAIRNLGRPGIAAMAISAVDVALWDLKAKLLDLPLLRLFGQARESVPVYGSGGFTSYTDQRLTQQTSEWVDTGINRIKIKVGREPARDPHRVAIVRKAIGQAELFVDANGAYSRKQAIALMQDFGASGVSWFEEPVPSDDLDGLRLIRDANYPGMDITAGEYGFQPSYFRQMLAAGAVDVLQADATRCGGFSGFLAAAAISDAFQIPLSSHCAPALHVHVGCAINVVRHIEYFHDHARIEQMLFDGFQLPQQGLMQPDLQRPGLGLEFKSQDAQEYEI